MKRMIYILAVVMAVGCHRSMAPWPGDGDKQDVAMYVRTRSLSGITASPSVYQFFVYDQVHSSMSRYSVNPEKEDNNVLHLKLFPAHIPAIALQMPKKPKIGNIPIIFRPAKYS